MFGCNLFNRNSSNSFLSESSGGGNGSGYDGKLVVLLSEENDFQCEGRVFPKEIISRNLKGEWSLTTSKLDKCKFSKVVISDVSYDPNNNTAIYNNKNYSAPLQYVVSNIANPNNNDLDFTDGVCEDSNYQCTLQAALSQISAISLKTISVNVPTGTFELNKPLYLFRDDGATNSYNLAVKLIGNNATSSSIDGKNRAAHFILGLGKNAEFSVQNLNFINGNSDRREIELPNFKYSIYTSSVFELAENFQAHLKIENCMFENNATNPVVVFGSAVSNSNGYLSIANSKFKNNEASVFIWETKFPVQIDSSVFENSILRFTNYNSNLNSNVEIKNSTFINSLVPALSLDLTMGTASLENLTFYNNAKSGIDITGGSYSKIKIVNSTFLNNGCNNNDANLKTNLPLTANLSLLNSVLVCTTGTFANCKNNGSLNLGSTNFKSEYNLFSDSTCGINGVNGNQVWDVMSGPNLFENLSYFENLPILIPATGSPLIDKGADLYCPINDQRKYSRPVDLLGLANKCDIGAIEVQ